MEALTISEVARQSGVRTSTLRYYESIGLLPPPQRVQGRRRYDSSIFSQLAILRLAQRAGFTLAEMRLLIHGFSQETPASERWQLLACQKLQEVEILITEVLRKKRILEQLLQCQCLSLEECARESERN